MPYSFECYFWTYMNLSKIAIGAGVYCLYWFYVLVLNGGYLRGLDTGVKLTYSSLWELLLGSCPRQATESWKFPFHIKVYDWEKNSIVKHRATPTHPLCEQHNNLASPTHYFVYVIFEWSLVVEWTDETVQNSFQPPQEIFSL